MNLRPTCTVPVDDQILEAFAYAINNGDLHNSTATRLLEAAAQGGQTCDCQDDDYEPDDDEGHECGTLLDAEQCMAQAQVYTALAQAAANAALAAATMAAARKS